MYIKEQKVVQICNGFCEIPQRRIRIGSYAPGVGGKESIEEMVELRRQWIEHSNSPVSQFWRRNRKLLAGIDMEGKRSLLWMDIAD